MESGAVLFQRNNSYAQPCIGFDAKTQHMHNRQQKATVD